MSMDCTSHHANITLTKIDIITCKGQRNNVQIIDNADFGYHV